MRLICWILMVLVFYSCDSGQVRDVSKAPTEEQRELESAKPGTSLSDSQIQSMVREEMKRRFPPEIDTAALLRQLLVNKGPITWSQRLDSALLAIALASSNPVPEELALAMEVSDYLGYWGGGKHWEGFVFLNRNQESHYGPSVVLLILNDSSLEWAKYILTQHYGREGYEYQQWAEPIATDSVRLVRDKRWGSDSTARQEMI
ncbi:MAG: hypothetical protein AAFU60_04920, partial [Bacteroidota bacterium]